MKTKILTVFTLIVFSACGQNTQIEKKSETVLDTQITTLKDAQKNVDAINAKTQSMNEIIQLTTSVSGASLYTQKCASCHGKNAQKSALNISQAIAGWSSTKITDTLNGYKNGTYGGSMKGLMQGQSKPLTDSDIKILSDYISIL